MCSLISSYQSYAFYRGIKKENGNCTLFISVCLFSAVCSLQRKEGILPCWRVDPTLLIRDLSTSMDGGKATYIGWRADLYEAVATESYSLCIVLRHLAPSSPICLSEVIRKPFALSRVFLLSSGGKSIVLVKKKAPSRSGILLSMHVVLKTRHVNPNIHVRRFIVHVRSPNLSATRPQLFSLRGATTSYRSLHKAI